MPMHLQPRRPFFRLLLLLAVVVELAVAFTTLPPTPYISTFPPAVVPVSSKNGARSERGRHLYYSKESDGLLDMNSRPPPTSSSHAVVPRSVNYFISRRCNYSCEFCFHTAKTYHALSLEEAADGLRLLAEAGCEKINFAGGEPFLHPVLLGELCRIASDELGLGVSIISNGSMITPEWMEMYAKYVDVLGVSVDSFDKATNAAIGRGGDAENGHVKRMLRVRDECSKHNVRFKLNTVVNSLNWKEDMNEQIEALDPYRWKVFQVLLLEGENVGGDGDLRDARHLCIDRSKFDAFVERHADRKQLIPEPNDVMQNSYLLLDEEMRFLDCSGGGKVPGRSILAVGVEEALKDAGFDDAMFAERGGIFEWRRPRDE